MIGLIDKDTDVLRNATNAWTVFWYRAGQGRWIVAGGGVLTLLLLALIALLMLGPTGLGLAWATRERVAVGLSGMGVLWTAYAGWALFKFVPSRNDRVVIALRNAVRAQVDPLEEAVRALSPEALRAKTEEFRRRLAAGESLDAVRPEAYACVREASRRARNHRQFECQLIGGRVIENCNVAEMKTGEGKTIVCYMANYMKVLQGLRVHMVTVNDYLVKRDAEFCRPIFELLGVTVGYILASMESYGPGAEERRASYACDITYGTNSEFGFDYLRDNMKLAATDQVQGPLNFVVVDEVDSILIDEARTPLIISGPAHDDVSKYRVADNIARMLIRKQEAANRETAERVRDFEKNPPPEAKTDPKFKDGMKKFKADPFWLSSDEAEAIGHTQYFVVEMDRKSAHMTEHGAKAAQAELAIGTFYDSKNMNWPHFIDNAVRAHLCYHKDKEYVVQDDVVIIVDEFTGRLMHGRQWSDGLHQAVEAKEKVTIKQETQTLATITLQNFFKLYDQLAGMTGTAMTEAEEFMKIYKLEVISIPTNRPVRRVDYNDKIYKTTDNKYEAIVEEIRSYSQNGYPADPWAIFEMFRVAQRQYRAAVRHNPADAESAEKLRVIETALSEFDQGKGDEGAMERGYRALLGERVGGRPVLVGTISVENSERLSQMLTRRYGIEHEVLNAKNHAREAEIVAKAGQQHEVVRKGAKEMHGNVTIATNMAGRGTDIVLGPGVAELGGLHVVGTERHESRRIDNQLRGRCGRQGDHGSSRFFLSLEDELLKLFMGEWTLKMLQFLGFEEGMAIEDRRINKGIERAQKKVEERNFAIRKNLLEYDEVMDHQRRTFYAMRQAVLEGRGLSERIWEMIDRTVDDAVNRYYDPRYPALCVAEWVGQHLEVLVSADKLDTGDLRVLQSQVRDLASDELRSSIQRTIGEYIDPDIDPEEWDVRGLCQWVSKFGLSYTQNQVRKLDPDQLQEAVIKAALDRIAEIDLSALEPYVDPIYPKARLAHWAREKFEVALSLDDLRNATREAAVELIRQRMRAAYRQREIDYPPREAIEFAMAVGKTNANHVAALIAAWANSRYRTDWTLDSFTGKSPQEVFEELRELQRQFIMNGRLESEVDRALAEHAGGALRDWAAERFGAVVERHDLSDGPDLRQRLIECGRELLCYELRELERHVLLSMYDSLWKDHMYAMDLLRSGIGLRGYAERDPKIEYKREGTRMFNEMLSNVRERVTDLIFKAQRRIETRQAPVGAGAYGGAQAQKSDATNAGFAQQQQQQQADRDAAAAAGGNGKVDPIRRTMPRVGRNDPCPCGSGKKYKTCHGRQ